MAESELDKQVKEAQILMYKAEADKAEAEKNTIELDYYRNKKFWFSGKFWTRLIVILAALAGFLGFFIPNVATPIAEHKAYILLDSVDKEKKDLKIIGENLRKKDDALKKKSDSLAKLTEVSKSLRMRSMLLAQEINRQKDSLRSDSMKSKQALMDLRKYRSEISKLRPTVDSINNITEAEIHFFRHPGGVVDFTFGDNSMGLQLSIFRLQIKNDGKIYTYYPHNFYRKGFRINLPFGEYNVIVRDGKYKFKNGSFKFKFNPITMKADESVYSMAVELPLEPK